MKKIKGIIFDMDNTILRSRIDFAEMKNETFQFLRGQGILPRDLNIVNHTTSTIIEEAVKTKMMTEELFEAVWEIPKKYEIVGMVDADLEPGVRQLLDELHGKYHLVIVTNNSIEAARTALEENNIIEYFDLVVGREMMDFLKPSSDGFIYVLKRYCATSANEWISVGDSWIDGKASKEAGIIFIAYQGDMQRMNEMGVYPHAEIMDIKEIKNFV